MPDPKVTLVSWTKDPIKTLCDVWWASKTEDPLDALREPDLDLFERIIAQRIPVAEHLDFVFIMEHVSVSWREQAVRHRIGVHVGDRIGVDIVPDLPDSSWWSQSMRIQDMGKFADNGAYRIPKTLSGKSVGPHREPAMELYDRTMAQIQNAYNQLVEAGVPMEDARDLIPLGAHHRISWKLNLAALQHIIGKRSCWILQASLWHPIIRGMIDEMATKVHPVFRNLAMPPCAKRADGDWCFNECVFHEENIRRVDGDDALPVCPLYFHHHTPWGREGKTMREGSGVPMLAEMRDRAVQYASFWGRDPYTLGPLAGGAR